MPLRDEVALHYNRLTNLPCAGCGAPPVDGEPPQLIAVPYCAPCAADKPLISADAAAIFNCYKNPEAIKALSDELVVMNHFLMQYREGKPCDECGAKILPEDPITVVSADTPSEQLLFVVCLSCKPTETPNVRKQADSIREHLVSNRAAIYLPYLTDLKKVMVN